MTDVAFAWLMIGGFAGCGVIAGLTNFACTEFMRRRRAPRHRPSVAHVRPDPVRPAPPPRRPRPIKPVYQPGTVMIPPHGLGSDPTEVRTATVIDPSPFVRWREQR